jgi:hypothetical protein
MRRSRPDPRMDAGKVREHMSNTRYQTKAACVALALALAGAVTLAGCEETQTASGRPPSSTNTGSGRSSASPKDLEKLNKELEKLRARDR